MIKRIFLPNTTNKIECNLRGKKYIGLPRKSEKISIKKLEVLIIISKLFLLLYEKYYDKVRCKYTV